MKSGPSISSLPTLMRLLDCDDLAAFKERLLDRAAFHEGDGFAEVKVDADSLSVMLGGAFVDAVGFDLAFPFTVDEFWQRCDQVDDVLLRRMTVVELARADRLYADSDDDDQAADEEALFTAVAELLSVEEWQLAQIIGGSWYTVGLDEGPARNERIVAWLYTGEPEMAALAIGAEWIDVAIPSFVPLGLAGPGRVEVETVASVRRGDEGWDERLRGALGDAVNRAASRCGICWNCRTLQQVWGPEEDATFVCLGCRVEAGLIID